LSLILEPNQTLGFFTNSGADGPLSFDLALIPSLVSDIRSGTEVGLYFTAASPEIGFTFDSRTFVVPSEQPRLEITAATRPTVRIDSIKLTNTSFVNIGFSTLSNWNYTLQAANGVNGQVSDLWANLLIVPGQASSGHVEYLDGISNRQRFYRLMVIPSFPAQ